jgi:hypothetical protein
MTVEHEVAKVDSADKDETALAVLALVVTVVRWRKRCGFCELTDLLDDWDLLNRITGGFHDRSICTKATTSFPRGHAD